MEPQGTQPPSPTPPPPKQQDDYAAASESTADYIQNLAPVKAANKKRKTRKIILLVVLVLAAAGAAAYFLLVRKSNTPQQAQHNQTTSEQSSAVAVDDQLTEKYNSQDLRLTLQHPKSWTLNDTTSGKLLIESPVNKVKDSIGNETDAKVVITLLASGSNPPGFTGPTGTAVLDSEKLTYTNPSQSQRKETYLTYVSFASVAGLDALYVTGDSGYTKQQSVPKADVMKIEPIVSVAFVKCEGAACNGTITMSPEDMPSNKLFGVAKSILQSLTIE